jgi:integrase
VIRRTLEDGELQSLLNVTATVPERYGMSGYERYLLYRFAVETGIRSNEIRSLTVSDFDFDNLTVTVKAGSSKHRRMDIQALKPDTALLLKEFFKNKTFNTKAFGGSYKQLTDRTAEMIKADLVATEVKDESGKIIRKSIPYIDEADRVFDFHSLRHQTGTELARAGVHPRDAQAFMHHSSIEITMKYYTHLRKGAEVETAAKIPDLSLSNKKIKAG